MRINKIIDLGLDDFGLPEEIIVEMANFRSNETGIGYAVHVRSKEETSRTAHSLIPTLKIYSDRPGNSEWFSVMIDKNPSIVPAHLNKEFTKSLSTKEIKLIQSWVIINYESLMNFWNNGGTWFEDEITSWKRTLKKAK